MKGVNFSCANFQRHNAAGLTIVEQQIEREEFTEEAHLVFHCALVHRLENHMAGAISRVAGASYRGLAEVARVAAEATLVDTSIRGAVKRQAAMFKFIDGIDRLTCQDLSRGLVYQVVTAFDGIVHVPFPMVFFQVAQRGSDTTLGRACVRARGVDFTEHGYAGIGQLHRSHQAGPTGADDDHVKFIVHSKSSL